MKLGESIERNKYVVALLAIIFCLMILAHFSAAKPDDSHSKILDFCLSKAGEVIAAFLTLVVTAKSEKHDAETTVTTTVASDKK